MPISTTVDIVKAIAKLIRKLSALFFRYPVIIDYVSQFETKIGYVFVIDVQTERNKVITIPKNRFEIKIKLDRALARKTDKSKLIYGEHVNVYDSEFVLQADIEGRSHGNVLSYVRCHKRPQRLFLLTRVEGPENQNPSARFQWGKVYQTAKIKLRKRLFSLTYIEIPIRKVILISGNEKTRIVDS
ncbi:MAG: hypothetical protein KAX39_02685 [candidate division Zixibacteria bacterium]|nr:hypothetical protein [candidate division Zixibacteria bacterium]